MTATYDASASISRVVEATSSANRFSDVPSGLSTSRLPDFLTGISAAEPSILTLAGGRVTEEPRYLADFNRLLGNRLGSVVDSSAFRDVMLSMQPAPLSACKFSTSSDAFLSLTELPGRSPVSSFLNQIEPLGDIHSLVSFFGNDRPWLAEIAGEEAAFSAAVKLASNFAIADPGLTAALATVRAAASSLTLSRMSLGSVRVGPP